MIVRSFSSMHEILHNRPSTPYEYFPAGLESQTESFGPCWMQIIFLATGEPHTVFTGPSVSGDLAQYCERFMPWDTDGHKSLANKLDTRSMLDGDVAILRAPKDMRLNYFVLLDGWKIIDEDLYRGWLQNRSNEGLLL